MTTEDKIMYEERITHLENMLEILQKKIGILRDLTIDLASLVDADVVVVPATEESVHIIPRNTGVAVSTDAFASEEAALKELEKAAKRARSKVVNLKPNKNNKDK